MHPYYRVLLPNLDAFVIAEPFYAIDESWAEEPSGDSWDADAGAVRDWLVRSN